VVLPWRKRRQTAVELTVALLGRDRQNQEHSADEQRDPQQWMKNSHGCLP
jgi:hypothetical protein